MLEKHRRADEREREREDELKSTVLSMAAALKKKRDQEIMLWRSLVYAPQGTIMYVW